jgi:hypothetical protein
MLAHVYFQTSYQKKRWERGLKERYLGLLLLLQITVPRPLKRLKTTSARLDTKLRRMHDEMKNDEIEDEELQEVEELMKESGVVRKGAPV